MLTLRICPALRGSESPSLYRTALSPFEQNVNLSCSSFVPTVLIFPGDIVESAAWRPVCVLQFLEGLVLVWFLFVFLRQGLSV